MSEEKRKQQQSEEEWAYSLLEVKSGYPFPLFAYDYEKTFNRRPPPYVIYLYIYMVEKLKYEGKWGKHSEDYWYNEFHKEEMTKIEIRREISNGV